jgi:hypothetical protein
LADGQSSVRDHSTGLEKDNDQECSMESLERLQSSEQKPIGNRPSRNYAKLTSLSILVCVPHRHCREPLLAMEENEHGAYLISRHRQGCAVPQQPDDVQVWHGGLDLPKEKDVVSTSEQTVERELLWKKGLVEKGHNSAC